MKSIVSRSAQSQSLYVKDMIETLEGRNLTFVTGPDPYSLILPINLPDGDFSTCEISFSKNDTPDGTVSFTFPWAIPSFRLFEAYRRLNRLTLDWRYAKFCVDEKRQVVLSIDFDFPDDAAAERTMIFFGLLRNFVNKMFDSIHTLCEGADQS